MLLMTPTKMQVRLVQVKQVITDIFNIVAGRIRNACGQNPQWLLKTNAWVDFQRWGRVTKKYRIFC